MPESDTPAPNNNISGFPESIDTSLENTHDTTDAHALVAENTESLSGSSDSKGDKREFPKKLAAIIGGGSVLIAGIGIGTGVAASQNETAGTPQPSASGPATPGQGETSSPTAPNSPSMKPTEIPTRTISPSQSQETTPSSPETSSKSEYQLTPEQETMLLEVGREMLHGNITDEEFEKMTLTERQAAAYGVLLWFYEKQPYGLTGLCFDKDTNEVCNLFDKPKLSSKMSKEDKLQILRIYQQSAGIGGAVNSEIKDSRVATQAQKSGIGLIGSEFMDTKNGAYSFSHRNLKSIYEHDVKGVSEGGVFNTIDSRTVTPGEVTKFKDPVTSKVYDGISYWVQREDGAYNRLDIAVFERTIELPDGTKKKITTVGQYGVEFGVDKKTIPSN